MTRKQVLDFSSRLPKIELPTSPAIEAMSRMLEPYRAMFGEIEARVRQMSALIAEPLRLAAAEAKKCERLRSAGWLPHSILPAEILSDEEATDSELDAAVERYYRENWGRISQHLVDRVARSEIDDEAKSTFGEAVAAHGDNYFRCAPRLLYPEIERVSRVELHDGTMEPITSQHALQERIADLTPYDLSDWGMAGFHFYDQLREHLYARCHHPDERERVVQSTIPNRHAALHGLTTYNTFKTSLNALLIADFAFSAITAIKRDDREQAQLAGEAISPAA